MKRTSALGFTIIEVVVAAAVILIGIALFIPAFQYCGQASQAAREKSAAMSAARGVVETLRGSAVRRIYSSYGPGGTIGPDFVVDGLSPLPSDPDGRCGKITFYSDESADMPEVGLPHDLNGDGDTDDSGSEVTNFYTIVPVEVAVEWRGLTGNKSVKLHAIVGDRREYTWEGG